MKKRTLIIIFSVIIMLGGITSAVVINLDRIMMNAAPELYISYMALNTVKEIEKEKDMIEEALPNHRKLTKSHNAEIALSVDKADLTVTEDYNSEEPSVIFNGIYNGTDFDGYINNSETGIAIPSLMDVYFTFSTKNFGDEISNGELSQFLPVDNLSGLDLTLPSDKGEAEELSLLKDFAINAKAIIQDAQITHDSGDDYFLILKSDNVKNGLTAFADALKTKNALKSKYEIFEKALGLTYDEAIDNLSEVINNADMGDTLVVRYTERKNYISKIETIIKNGDADIELLWEAKNGVRLLEDYTIRASVTVDDSEVGVEYNEKGNKFFRLEEKQDIRELKFIFGNEEILNASINLNYDNIGREFEGSFKLNDLSTQISGVFDEAYTEIKSDRVEVTGENIGSFKLNIRDFKDLKIGNIKKYPFKYVKTEDLASIIMGTETFGN